MTAALLFLLMVGCGAEGGLVDPADAVKAATPDEVAAAPVGQTQGATAVRDASKSVTATAITPILATTETPVPTPGEDVSRLVRSTAFSYWETWHSYDADKVLEFLEPSYRAAEDEEIRRKLRRTKLFRVKLRVTEDSPPVRLESGQWEMFLTMKTPIDSRRIRMTFLPEEDRCWITFSGETE